MKTYKTIAKNPNSTVASQYTPVYINSEQYQSESDLEKQCITLLKQNGYEYLTITTYAELVKNLRVQLEKLNNFNFSHNEWQQIFNNYIANKNEGIDKKTFKIQEDSIYSLRCDDGINKNIRIIDKDTIHNNSVQVIRQYEAEGTRKNRYDVTILINGFPMVHIELKRRGISIREAFNQIQRYQRESFWSDTGLFEYIQLFVISNGTNTKYYSNTTREKHLQEQSKKHTKKKTSNSFEFTCWWTDAKNKRIPDLVDFTKTFFSKHTLLSIITKYCVFTSDSLLLVMRPYQIAACEGILNKIAIATNHKQLGTVDGGGYIWHTTGSGKTLTSFKTAQIASKMHAVAKVLFVVDRKDLDYQTMKEYDKFEKGAADSNTSTKKLIKQLKDSNSKIIITTIQKLSRFIAKNKGHDIFHKHVVLIFDECHRSQCGNMHKDITRSFKKYNIFGFTGTPIFAKNAVAGANPQLKTTEQVFGEKLHSYTIVDAINDENVLPLKIDYVNTLKVKKGVKDKKVSAIDSEKVVEDPRRVSDITNYIIKHFDQKTKRNNSFYFDRVSNIKDLVYDKAKEHNDKIQEQRKQNRLRGFNSIFAVSSIKMAKKYYEEFKNKSSNLKIAIIYSFGANDCEDEVGLLPDEDIDTTNLDQTSRDFLESAIQDYNKEFKVNYDTSSDKFENYYKDLSMRVKNRELDILIVVNMFLTGFDATTLNTLWVDKNLKYHGLIQAFSRTNRILNSVKTFGNIVCFRDLEQATNDALAIFGDKNASSIVLLKSYEDYYYGWDKDGKHQKGYLELITKLQNTFPLPVSIEGEQAEKDFISLWGAILRIVNILHSFDEFVENKIITEREYQDYQSKYLDLYEKYCKNNNAEKEDISDDIEFEIELIKQVIINIDYILQLVAKYHKSNMQDKKIRGEIDKAMSSNIELRSKKQLIEKFIDSLNINSDVIRDWKEFAQKQKEEELDKIITQENLELTKTKTFMKDSFRDGEIKAAGIALGDILPPISLFDKNNTRQKKKQHVLDILQAFFEKYLGV